MRIFDFHTHAFTDSLAERALAGLAETSGITPATDGTVRGLRDIMRRNGITGALLLPVATKPSQQTVINDWAASEMHGGILCCGSVHPDAPDALEEVRRIASLGLCGVKFHSEYQHFCPDEERMLPIYREAARCGLIAVFHGGWDPFGGDDIRCTPERMARAVSQVPELTFVAAHLGGIKLWDDVEKHLAGRFGNLYLDVSVIARYISDGQLLRIIRQHGAERILFGSDCPWDDPANEIAMIERLPLTDRERELIFFRNAEQLLGVENEDRFRVRP